MTEQQKVEESLTASPEGQIKETLWGWMEMFCKSIDVEQMVVNYTAPIAPMHRLSPVT